jgi:hypothetical protein
MGHRSGFVVADGELAPAEFDDAARQDPAHDLQRFFGERDHLASAAPGAAHRGDAGSSCPTADPQDDPTAGKHAE